MTPTLYKLFQRTEKEETFFNSIHKASITLIQIQQHITKKKKEN